MFEFIMGFLVGYYFSQGNIGMALVLALMVFVLEKIWGYMTQPEG